MTSFTENDAELNEMSQRLAQLNELGQSLTSTLQTDTIYATALSAVQTLFHAEGVLLFRHDNQRLEVVASIGERAENFLGKRLVEGEGIAGKVWQTEQSLWLQGDACEKYMSRKLAEAVGYFPQSIVAVPLKWRDRQLGVIEAIHRQPQAFAQIDIKFLEMAAAWVAIALYNAQQHGRLQKQLLERQALAGISEMLNETLDLDVILPLITEAARQLIARADWAAIHLLEGKPPRLYPLSVLGLELGADEYVLDIDEGIAGEVLRQEEAINVFDLQADPRRVDFDRNRHIRSLLVVPLHGHTGTVGTISVQCAVPAAFSADDERVLKALGSQAALAIENGRLYRAQQEARRLAEYRLRRIHQLTRQAITAEEEERKRLALELHDEAGQSLTALKISLDLLRLTVSGELQMLNEGLGEAVELTEQTMENIRLLSHNLRPPGLDRFGLHLALEGLCQDFMARTKIAVHYNGLELPNLPWAIAISLYRCAQEALTNVAKHADARNVWLSLSQMEGYLVLEVSDDGRGIGVDVHNLQEMPQGGIGLSGIAERLELLNGRLDLHSTPNSGTRLVAQVPLWDEEVRRSL
ncbi:MAG: GAF domain-containing sensor histidine kinase [Anaerolineales bacterium]|nr:GAF domain-containing sensor histidine kinase [Anaerolineales bacterium]